MQLGTVYQFCLYVLGNVCGYKITMDNHINRMDDIVNEYLVSEYKEYCVIRNNCSINYNYLNV